MAGLVAEEVALTFGVKVVVEEVGFLFVRSPDFPPMPQSTVTLEQV